MADYYANHAVRVDGFYSESAVPDGTNGVPLAIEYRIPYTSGSGDYQCNKRYSARLTTSPTTIDLDLASVLADPLGNFISWTKIRGILIVNRSATSGSNCTVAGDFVTSVLESSGAGSIVVKPGGSAYFEAPIDGYTVVAGTGDGLSLTFTDTTLGVDLFIWGS